MKKRERQGVVNSFYNDFDEQCPKSESPAEGEYRSVFALHRDRVIHTSAFRRLQSKTQVFFAGEYDFYRTRLTHSIEVAQIGRSICSRLNQVSDLLCDQYYLDSDLVEAACLAHDIGHPPFGHTGERVLNEQMREFGGFEGNAQTLRLLTETIYSNGGKSSGRGMNPSRALLDGVLKYKTLYKELNSPENHFLYDDQADYLDFVLNGETFPAQYPAGKKRDSFRSIECQVMDWADDTAYSLNDITDGARAGFIRQEKLEEWAGEQDALNASEQKHLEYLISSLKEGKLEPRWGRKIGAFIAAVELIERPDDMLSDQSARHRYSLSIDPAILEECSLYKKIATGLVFRSAQLQQLDHKSRFMLTRLFEVFAETYLQSTEKPKHRLLPAKVEGQILSAADQQSKARLLCDHLAGMTDGFAIRTYKRLFDPDFGSIVDLI